MLTSTDKSAAIASLVEPLRNPFTSAPSTSDEDMEVDADTDAAATTDAHLLSLSHSVRTYKLLLSGGHFNSSTKSIDVIDPALPAAFASAVWEAITSEYAGGNDNAVKVAAGAPFVVVEMLAALPEKEAKEAKKVLGAKAAKETIEASEAKGVSLLLERLA